MRALYDLPAPAKINLFLHIVGRRNDGYHLLQSVFTLIDWCDTLHIELRTDAQLHRHDLGTPLPADDLCLRAARALQHAAGITLGADISIDKRLPSGAGLGGGSSDAATTLLALNHLWKLHWPRQRLLDLALTLGADVPFFVGGRTAWVEGIGEQLTPINWPHRSAIPPEAPSEPRARPHPTTHRHTMHRQWLAVLKPTVSIPTSAIFNSPLLARDTKRVIVSDFLAAPTAEHTQCAKRVTAWSGFGHNDLQRPAQAYSKEVDQALTQALSLLHARFGNSRMTGSGSAVFADAGFGILPRTSMIEPDIVPRDWVGRMCHCLNQHPLLDWAD